MRKNSKKEATNGTAAVTTVGDSITAEAKTPAPKKKSAAAKSTRKAASKKTTAKAAAKKTAAPKRTRSPKPAGPSDADIQLRAYFIAERRVQLALQGDPARDWLEAKRQLLEEAGQARS